MSGVKVESDSFSCDSGRPMYTWGEGFLFAAECGDQLVGKRAVNVHWHGRALGVVDM